jgi:hypothetical protein
MVSTILGTGTGPANTLSIQIPALTRQALESKQTGGVICDGAGK